MVENILLFPAVYLGVGLLLALHASLRVDRSNHIAVHWARWAAFYLTITVGYPIFLVAALDDFWLEV